MHSPRKQIPGLALCLVLATTISAQQLKPVRLPPPQKKGGIPLMEALGARRSQRNFKAEELPLDVISSMLWAAWGINRTDEKKRTAPSARNNQEIDVYVTTAYGIYLYDAAQNMLLPVAAGDYRAQTGGQQFVGKAPVNLIYVADCSRMKNIGKDDRRMYYGAGAGYISQNVYLYCASQGLATVARGMINRKALAKTMKLKDSQKIVLAQTVGYPGRK